MPNGSCFIKMHKKWSCSVNTHDLTGNFLIRKYNEMTTSGDSTNDAVVIRMKSHVWCNGRLMVVMIHVASYNGFFSVQCSRWNTSKEKILRSLSLQISSPKKMILRKLNKFAEFIFSKEKSPRILKFNLR